jgi:hypothetical protein
MKTYLGAGHGWTAAAGGSGSGFTNPMTAAGDLIVGGASGVAARLGKGANGQVLGVVGGVLTYVTPEAPGIANPLTSQGDIFIGGVSGAPSRLPIGGEGYHLAVVGGALTYVAPVGFANPMTTTGDLLKAGAGGNPSRLGIGMDGSILTVVAGQPSWLAQSNFRFLPAPGANGQVLSIVAGVPTYTDPAGGGNLSNPMTTPGDMIVGGLAGAPTRLAPGTDGFVLTMVAGAPAFAPPPATSSASAVTLAIHQTAHGFSVGQLLYFNGTAYAKAKADVGDTSEVVGMVSSLTDADNFYLTSAGFIAGLSGLIPGKVYYLSDTVAGGLSIDPPTTPGHIFTPVMVSISTSTGWFKIERGSVVTAPGQGSGSGTALAITAPAEIRLAHPQSMVDLWDDVAHKYTATTSDVLSNGETYPFQDTLNKVGSWIGMPFEASVPVVAGSTYKWTLDGALYADRYFDGLGGQLDDPLFSAEALNKPTVKFGAQVWQSITLRCEVTSSTGEVTLLEHFIPVVTSRTYAKALKVGGDIMASIQNNIQSPGGVLKWQTGNGIYFASTLHVLSQDLDTGVITAIAGSASQSGFKDDFGTMALFYNITHLAYDSNGHILVSDTNNHKIRRINKDTHEVTTVAGTTIGQADGAGTTTAQFNSPRGLAVIGTDIYVADSGNYAVRKIDAAGDVTTVAGVLRSYGAVDGPLGTNRLPFISALAHVDMTWNATDDVLMIAGGGAIFSMVIATGVVTKYAGNLNGDLNGNVNGSLRQDWATNTNSSMWTSYTSQMEFVLDTTAVPSAPWLYVMDGGYLRRINLRLGEVKGGTQTVAALGVTTGGNEIFYDSYFQLDGVLPAGGAYVRTSETYHLKAWDVTAPYVLPEREWGILLADESSPTVRHPVTGDLVRVSALRVKVPIGSQMGVAINRPKGAPYATAPSFDVVVAPSFDIATGFFATFTSGDPADTTWAARSDIPNQPANRLKSLWTLKWPSSADYQDYTIFVFTGSLAITDNVYCLGNNNGFNLYISPEGWRDFSSDHTRIEYYANGAVYQVIENGDSDTGISRYFYNADGTMDVVLTIGDTTNVGPDDNMGAVTARKCIYAPFGGVNKLTEMAWIDPTPYLFYTTPATPD